MAYLKLRDRANGRPSYVVCWTDSAGRECQRTYRDRSAANRALRELIAREARQEISDEAAARQLLRDVADDWLRAVGLEVKPRTLASYQGLLVHHVVPSFGARRIGDVSSHEIQQWVVELAQQDLSHKTIRNIYGPLAATFRYAADHHMIRVSPCTRLRLPKHSNSDEFEGVFLSTEQVESIAAMLDRQAAMLGLVVRFVASTGLRAAEVTGLQLGDIDLDRGVVHVRRTLARDKQKRHWSIGTPKSKRSRREVPVLDAAALAKLARAHQQSSAGWHSNRMVVL